MNILTVNDVASLLKIKPSTVYAWVEQGKIPVRKLNGSLRFVEHEIMAWMDSCKPRSAEYNNLRR